MACGYQNSAGTDLDSLFYTSNQGGGAVGYLDTSNVDLGNKYTNSSTLGYSVGYQNSSGTDLGYLRGNVIAPTVSGVICNVSNVSSGYKRGVSNCASGESYYSGRQYAFFNFTADIGLALSSTMYTTLMFTFGVSSSDTKYSINNIVDYVVSSPLSNSGYKQVRAGNGYGSWNEASHITSTYVFKTSNRPYAQFIVELKHRDSCDTGYYNAPSFWVRLEAWNDAGSTGNYYICIWTAGTKSTSSTHYGKYWGTSASSTPSNTTWA